MKYNLLKNLDPDLWTEIMNSSKWTTFFHTPLWTSVFTQTFPQWENVTWGIEFEDGNKMVFPLLRRRVLPGLNKFYWYESTAPGTYGGPIFSHAPRSEHYAPVWQELRKFPNMFLVNNPFAPWDIDSFQIQGTFIQVIELEADFDKILRNFSKGRRKTIRYAKRNGVKAEIADFSRSWREYYGVYQDQLQRWGSEASDFYPSRLFKNLGAASAQNEQIKLWVARLDSRIVSGLVVFYHHPHLVTWHGATLQDYYRYRPVDLLYAAVIEDACRTGYSIFDFACSGGHDSVVFFKERYGAKRVPLRIYRRRSLPGKVYQARRLLRNHLRLCPEE